MVSLLRFVSVLCFSNCVKVQVCYLLYFFCAGSWQTRGGIHREVNVEQISWWRTGCSWAERWIWSVLKTSRQDFQMSLPSSLSFLCFLLATGKKQSMDRFWSRLPKSVVKAGRVIDIRDSLRADLQVSSTQRFLRTVHSLQYAYI